MCLHPIGAQHSDFFAESGVIVKNTSRYTIEKHERKLNPIFFKRIKDYHANKINGAISVSINTTSLRNDFEHHIAQMNYTIGPSYKVKLCNFTKLCHLYHNSQAMFDALVNIKAKIESLLDFIENAYDIKRNEEHDKRQILSLFLGVASLTGVTVNRVSITRMEAHLRRQDEKLTKFSKIFRTTNKLFRRLTKDIKAMRTDALLLSQRNDYTEMANVVIQNFMIISDHYDRIFNDLEGAIAGQFPTHLIKYSDVQYEYNDYLNSISRYNMKPLDVFGDIIKTQFHLTVVNNVIHIIFDVPLVRVDAADVFNVYEFIGNPISYREEMVDVKTSNKLILHNGHTNQLSEISDDFYSSCIKESTDDPCGFVAKITPSTCLEKMFLHQLHYAADLVAENCNIRILDRTKNLLKAIDSHTAMIFLAAIYVISFTCTDGYTSFDTESDSYVSSLYVIKVKVFCKIVISSGTAYLNKVKHSNDQFFTRPANLSFNLELENIFKKSIEANITLPNLLLTELDKQISGIEASENMEANYSLHAYMTTGFGIIISFTISAFTSCLVSCILNKKLKDQRTAITHQIAEFMVPNTLREALEDKKG